MDEWFIKFEIISKAKEWDEMKMAKMVACHLGAHAFTAYLSAGDEAKKDYQRLKEYLCKRFRPANPFGYWRNQFRSRKQAIKESIVSYAHGLQAIVKKLMYDPSNVVSDAEMKEVFHKDCILTIDNV